MTGSILHAARLGCWFVWQLQASLNVVWKRGKVNMNPDSIKLKTGSDIPLDEIVDLYNSVGWLAYTNDEQRPKLQEAIRNSTYVVTAWSNDKLVGLARCLSDDVAICYLQDILIDPEYQRQGIGRKLLHNCLERFAHVRMQVLLTDDEERQIKFYESLNYKNTKDLKKTPLNVFVQIAGRELE
jgi:ribosomal protein S18 acetylase RimI-like enzyme